MKKISQIKNDEKLPLYTYCNFCDEVRHMTNECQRVTNLLRMNHRLKSNYSRLQLNLLLIEQNTISRIQPLYNSYFMFFTIEYKDRPFYYFRNIIKKIDIGSVVTIKIYPQNNRIPSNMVNFYVYTIKFTICFYNTI